MPTARRGRRPGGEDTRALILEAARAEFAAAGYDGTSVRAVARAAGVDPRLVHHYFDGKSSLFAAVIAVPVNPAERVQVAVAGPPEGIGERLVRTLVSTWDEPVARDALVGVVRSAMGSQALTEQLRGFVVGELMMRVVRAHPVSADLSRDELTLRAGLLGAQMVGLVVGRYVVGMAGLRDASAEELVARVGPAVQAILETGSPHGIRGVAPDE